MAKVISSVKLSDTLSLSECNNGWRLYDKERCQNIAMAMPTERDAMVKALTYYQKRTARVEAELDDIRGKVNAFVGQFIDEDEDMEGWNA